jgi:hypothetical protein
MKEALGGRVVCVYLFTDEIKELDARLNVDGRDASGARLIAGKAELERFFTGEYDGSIDRKINNINVQETAKAILDYFRGL